MSWRAAGITYLEYLNTATTLLRRVVKEAAKKKYNPREEVHYRITQYAAGKPVKRDLFVELNKAAAAPGAKK